MFWKFLIFQVGLISKQIIDLYYGIYFVRSKTVLSYW